MATKDRRREFRVASSDDDLLIEAAGLTGVSVSEFVLHRAVSDAEAIVDAHRSVTLDDAAFTRFMDALDSPPERLERLVEQARRARPIKRAE